jgi:hypothetical protein
VTAAAMIQLAGASLRLFINPYRSVIAVYTKHLKTNLRAVEIGSSVKMATFFLNSLLII